MAWFRKDLAPESLGALMNRLAYAPQNILVSREFLENNTLQIGDPLVVDVFPEAGARLRDTFLIAGIYEHFPTTEPETIMLIGNLEHIFAFFGVTMPHHIWMRLAEGIEGQTVLKSVERDMGVATLGDQVARAELRREQAKMERVGVFGTLSVSFLAATVMAALGLLTYSYASLEERRRQLAVLRAMGTSRGQIVRQISVEYLILIIFGGVMGVGIGTLAAQAFVPLFRIAKGLETPMPPLIPIVALGSVLPLTTIFVVIMLSMQLVLIAVTLQNRLYSALRM